MSFRIRSSLGARRNLGRTSDSAGRVCALPVEVGGSVGDGDDVAFVEAMKMEIPVASPAAGKLKSILVSLDDVVAEGQVLAIIET